MEAFLEGARHWTTTVLVWIGFGTVVGLIARALMPGRDQGGTLATLLMGIAGTIVGMGTIAYFWDGHRATPVSFVGFAAGIGGSFLLLFCHRVLQGAFFSQPTTASTTSVVLATPKHHQRSALVIQQK